MSLSLSTAAVATRGSAHVTKDKINGISMSVIYILKLVRHVLQSFRCCCRLCSPSTTYIFQKRIFNNSRSAINNYYRWPLKIPKSNALMPNVKKFAIFFSFNDNISNNYFGTYFQIAMTFCICCGTQFEFGKVQCVLVYCGYSSASAVKC